MPLNGSYSVGASFRRTYSTNTAGSTLNGSANENVGGGAVETTVADGTASGQADEAWGLDIPIAGSGSTTIDLQALASIQGNKSLQKLKVLHIRNLSTTAADKVVVGNAGTNAWTAPFDAATDTVDVFGSSDLFLTNILTGWTVDATHKLLKIANPGGTSITVRVTIAGVKT
jgi:hypothetical protein